MPRFTRRPAGAKPLSDAIKALADQDFDVRVVHLERQDYP